MATAVESTGEKKKRRMTENKQNRGINNKQDNPAEVLVAPGPATSVCGSSPRRHCVSGLTRFSAEVFPFSSVWNLEASAHLWRRSA